MQRCTTLETTPVVLRPSEATKASQKFLQALPLGIMQLQRVSWASKPLIRFP